MTPALSGTTTSRLRHFAFAAFRLCGFAAPVFPLAAFAAPVAESLWLSVSWFKKVRGYASAA